MPLIQMPSRDASTPRPFVLSCRTGLAEHPVDDLAVLLTTLHKQGFQRHQDCLLALNSPKVEESPLTASV